MIAPRLVTMSNSAVQTVDNRRRRRSARLLSPEPRVGNQEGSKEGIAEGSAVGAGVVVAVVVGIVLGEGKTVGDGAVGDGAGAEVKDQPVIASIARLSSSATRFFNLFDCATVGSLLPTNASDTEILMLESVVGARETLGVIVGADEGIGVGFGEGTIVGTLDGAAEGNIEGALEGSMVGEAEGNDVGVEVGSKVGEVVGTYVGRIDGSAVGEYDGMAVGLSVGP